MASAAGRRVLGDLALPAKKAVLGRGRNGRLADAPDEAALKTELAALRTERDTLLERVRLAEGLLADAGRALDRLRDLERRIEALGPRYVEALVRIRELEQARGQVDERTRRD